ncbi:hypothetical protein Lesp02_33160 [Lentzea sp. NBRC 105346]|nr:hypothetical protein Lesp02_33160 [Lentzea sp. NBRC 105346]
MYVPPTVGSWNPDSATGARVLHVPSGAPERDTPLDIQPYEYVPLTAKPTFTGPDWSHPAFREACRDVSDADQAFLADHANGDAFVSALRRLTPSPRHQLGGHSVPIQDAAETAHTTLLAQFDSDSEADMRWGDLGTLFWMIPPTDLAAGDFTTTSFTWQCT